jgi:thiamine thiazole synthase
MAEISETGISKVILNAYHKKILERIESDVIIVGAGPSGLSASIHLARNGLNVTLMEKRLSPGGGIWGGGMAMNEVVVQSDAVWLLDGIGVRNRPVEDGLCAVDAIELASALVLNAVHSGVVLLNLIMVEDVCVHQQRVIGVVANRTMIGENLPVDPIMFSAKAVIDASGHDADVVEMLRRRESLPESVCGGRGGENAVHAASGESFVVEKACEIFPGLWISGMSVCAALRGPRMGPIFGGMLLSGHRVAELILKKLEEVA